MKLTITILTRRLFQEQGGPDNLDSTISASATSDAIFQLINDTSATIQTPFSPLTLSTVDFSVTLTILVLITALSFMALFSAYIHSLATDDSSSYTDNRRRNLSPPSPTNRKGLDPSAIKSLPLVACGVAAKHMIEECTICLSEFEDSEIVRIIPYCKHMYHPKCIDRWLSLHVTCPLCRSPQLFENVDELSLDMKQENNNNVVEIETVHNVATWRDEREFST
ncbi:Hypothetical predicted protein [Olea europaea subsp. europaea]|uniref:RING-type E3 ubiquitin transferase n=1 Tax=Olea europaea subsp. europaea TaxID=158383 RepID=A0A8S0PS37_OLEEU|nr:Hypothetical predicted protein [Olea europaea subsp. europaea]